MNLRRTILPGTLVIGLVLAGCAATSTGSGTSASPAKTTVAVPKSSPSPTTASPTPHATSAAASAPATPDAAGVVEAYFAAINAQDYEQAWSLGGKNLGASYSQFVSGFADTVTDTVEVLSTSGNTVTVNLTATQTDGSQKQFTGTYTVTGQAISSASISQVGGAAPTTSLCGAPANPYGYNFCGNGSYVTTPPTDICNYFPCIESFSKGDGYMVECKDGTFSLSGGEAGACSYHEGEEQPVYSGS